MRTTRLRAAATRNAGGSSEGSSGSSIETPQAVEVAHNGGRSIDTVVFTSISSLTNAEIDSLKTDYAITSLDDVAVLDKDDFDEILGANRSTFIKRRRLQTLARFLRNGRILNGSTGDYDRTS